MKLCVHYLGIIGECYTPNQLILLMRVLRMKEAYQDLYSYMDILLEIYIHVKKWYLYKEKDIQSCLLLL